MRHGIRSPKVDGPLIGYKSTDPDNSCPEIWTSVRQIIQQGLLATQIIVSPYLRTRQTALLVQHGYYKLTGQYLPITIDTRLGEYAHRHCRLFTPAIEDFDSETLDHYGGRIPLCRESPDLLIQRVTQAYTQLPSDAVVITHYGIADLMGMIAHQDIKLEEGQFRVLLPIGQSGQAKLINSPAH